MSWKGPPPPFFPAENSALDRTQLSEILPRLFLTNFKGAEDEDELKRVGATHIAAVGNEFLQDEGKAGITYWRKDITDDEKCALSNDPPPHA